MEMEKDKIVFKGSHPDSLYRVAADSGAGGSKLTRVFRLLRWPVALLAVCIALAAFVYFLMPDNFEPNSIVNGTYWEPVAAGVGLRGQATQNEKSKAHKDITNKPGAKTSEIDFYEADDDKDDIDSIMDALTNIKRGPPIPPVFPTHLTPEVQYGNEKADSEKRTPKLLDSSTSDDSTLKPHITQKPEKPLAIYFNDATAATTETITRSETLNDFSNYDQKQTSKKVEEPLVKTHPSAYKEYVVPAPKDFIIQTEDIPRQQGNNPALAYPPQVSEYYNHAPSIDDSSDVNFTSGHSKLFGISIEDAERMKSTTQSSLYNTRVSPTLPTWRDGDDTTTKKYPTNIYSDVQCRSTRMPLCLGVLPYDLAGAAVKIGDVEITSLMPQIEYLMATNCSDRIRHFVCALLEPECSPPPFPPKLPCHNLCSAIVDNCDGHIPRELIPAFNCKQYSHDNCVAAKTPCYSREFTCSDGSCIPRDWICDSRNDCAGGEDEQKCTQCDATEFKCGSGACILKRWLCDGYTDCPDGEDEGDGLCGPEHVRAPADRRGEPGEDAAGSAPAPAVRRPNKVPLGHRKPANRHSENDSSKELLVTSYSNNAFTLMRNFTPSPSRLTPYNRSSLRGPYARKHKKEESIEAVPEEVQEPENAEPNTTESATQGGIKTIFENESVEDVNMGDLGFLDDVEKEGKTADGKPNVSRPKQVQRMNLAPAPSIARPMRPAPPEVIAPEKFTKPRVQLNKATSNFAKVIDGAALLKKASMAAAEEAAELEKEPNNTSIETGAMPALSGGVGGGGAFGAGRQAWGGAHASPCPSGELRCVDGRCIALAQLCDGAIDCSDHADEDNCYT